MPSHADKGAVEAIGVAAIPNSAFYANKAEGRHLVRWAFCKSDAVLDEGLARPARLVVPPAPGEAVSS